MRANAQTRRLIKVWDFCEELRKPLATQCFRRIGRHEAKNPGTTPQPDIVGVDVVLCFTGILLASEMGLLKIMRQKKV
jgi:hypothetical protein